MSDRKKKFDAAQALSVLAEVERAIDSGLTQEEREFLATPRTTHDGQAGQRTYAPGTEVEAQELFDLHAAREVAEALMEKMAAALELKESKLYEKAVKVVYAMEEQLAGDPGNAELKKAIEDLRATHLRDYGKPLPPKKG